MPFIHIQSLPVSESTFSLNRILPAVSSDFSKALELDTQHITVTWQFYPPNSYSVAGKVSPSQPKNSHPILVEVFAPDFNSQETVEKMLTTIANSIAEHAAVNVSNVFISFRPARSGQVFSDGDIVRWDNP